MKAIDFFCGAGIGALGFQKAGIDIIQAFDNKNYAVHTYNKNVKPVAEVRDIAHLNSSQVKKATLHISTPVCKSFSVAGKGRGEYDEEHGNLFASWLTILEKRQPEFFLVENVDGLVNKKHRPFFDWLIGKLLVSGYRVDWRVLDAYDYGVPQKRNRVFILGRRTKGEIIFPTPTKRISIRKAIGDLGEPEDNPDIRNHLGHGIRPDEALYADLVPIGGNWKNLPSENMKREFMKGAYASGGGRTGYLRKVSMDEPAFAITSSMNGKFNAQLLDRRDKYGKDYELKSNQKFYTRRFTVRECLRLQTVPDSFYFDDTISLLKQYERCSGIPTELAYLFGKCILEMAGKK